jgi:hypothetical protein
VLGQPVSGGFRTRFCGQGDLTACRDSLWQAVDDAGDELAAAQGTNRPVLWRMDATPERIRVLSPVLTTTMRWTNRPTFQQAISYSGHR